MNNIFKQLFLLTFILLQNTINVSATNISVVVSTPGSLEYAILAQVSDLSTVTGITISGILNEYDYTIIKNSLINLEEIDMEEVDMTGLPNHLFNNRTKLKTIILPVNLTSIGDYAFFGCSGLTSIEIPDGVTSIGNDASAKMRTER